MSNKKNKCEELHDVWSLTITKGDNGYVINYKQDQQPKVFVIQELEFNEDGELEAAKELVHNILEYFGIYYNKHNTKNLVVEIQPNKDLEE